MEKLDGASAIFLAPFNVALRRLLQRPFLPMSLAWAAAAVGAVL